MCAIPLSSPYPQNQPYSPDLGEIPIGHGHSNDEVIAMWLHDKSANTQEMYRRVVYQFLQAVEKPIQWVTLKDLQAYADPSGGNWTETADSGDLFGVMLEKLSRSANELKTLL
ncbi:MAG: hypothetical protein WBB43_17730 [Limnoraphis sp.]